MENANNEQEGCGLTAPNRIFQEPSTSHEVDNKTFEAIKFTSDTAGIYTGNLADSANKDELTYTKDKAPVDDVVNRSIEPDGSLRTICESDKSTMRKSKVPQDLQDTASRCHHCEDNADPTIVPEEQRHETQQEIEKKNTIDSASMTNNATESTSSIRSIGSFVCRICHNAECPERLVSPCLCKGTLAFVHIYCLEHWISTSGKTKCELCQYQYKTIQTLRYTCLQSLRMWYSHTMSRRALQEDCQMFSLLTLVAFGIVGTILVGIQYYVVQGRNTMTAITRIWTKGWLLFFLFTTFTVYFVNVYLIVKGHLSPWYRWWQSARDIKLILENRKTVYSVRTLSKPEATPATISAHLQEAYRSVPIAEEEVAMGTVFLNLCVRENGENDGRRHALLPVPNASDETPTTWVNHDQQQLTQLDEQNQRVVSSIEI